MIFFYSHGALILHNNGGHTKGSKVPHFTLAQKQSEQKPSSQRKESYCTASIAHLPRLDPLLPRLRGACVGQGRRSFHTVSTCFLCYFSSSSSTFGCTSTAPPPPPPPRHSPGSPPQWQGLRRPRMVQTNRRPSLQLRI